MSGHVIASVARRAFLAGTALLFTHPFVPSFAQSPVRRIAYLSPLPHGPYRLRVFREELAELGYVEDQDIALEYFLAERDGELPSAAQRAVDSEPDVIVAINSPAALLVKNLTSTIPTVFAGVGDPVGAGLVTSLSAPGGNLTGPSIMTSDLSGKRLQLLADVVPDLARVGRLHWRAAEISEADITLAGKALNIDVVSRILTTAAELGGTLDSVLADGAQAIYFRAGPILSNNVELFVAETHARQLPAISDNRIYPDSGGLMSYGASLPDTFRHAAYYVDRILKGARPDELPVEQARLIDLVINLRTARALGIEIPPKLLIQATELIE